MNDLLMTGIFSPMPGFGMSPALDSSLGLPSQSPGLGEKQFVDLLGLVSDLEVADSQVDNAPLFLEQQSEKTLKALRSDKLGADTWTASDGFE